MVTSVNKQCLWMPTAYYLMRRRQKRKEILSSVTTARIVRKETTRASPRKHSEKTGNHDRSEQSNP